MADKNEKTNSKDEVETGVKKVKMESRPIKCQDCKQNYCVWRNFETSNTNMLLGLRRWVSSSGSPAKARKKVYQCVTRQMNGVMGIGNRKRLPRCVENNVRLMFPSEDGCYMGYKEK